MDIDDDEPSCSSTPNDFLLSTYKENPYINSNQTNINENLNTILTYKCRLCRKMIGNPILTCSECVNTGQFCSSKHEMCSNKRREILSNMLNKTDYEEFQQHANNKSIVFLCSERMFLLKKFNTEKQIFQSEFRTKIKSSNEINQMSEKIQSQKARLKLISHSIERLKEQIERKKMLNSKTQQCINEYRLRIEIMGNKLNGINLVLNASRDEIQKNIDFRTKQEKKLHLVRLQRMNELHRYLFPIERVTTVEEQLATRIRALLNAQKTTVEETNTENEEILIDEVERYQIVNSLLPTNGDYQIANLLSTVNVHENSSDSDSPQLSLSYEFYDVISALSHACQLVNVIALHLEIHLPFRLHQLEFNIGPFTLDSLRADIAKLNANIITCCFSQGILIESTNVMYTLENLWKLLTFQEYPNRPKSILYSQKYIDMIEEEVNEESRAYLSDYWFDDAEKATTDPSPNDEWEAITQNDNIPDDPSIYEYFPSLPSSSGQQHSSIMSNSFDYLKSKSSVILNSFVRNFKP